MEAATAPAPTKVPSAYRAVSPSPPRLACRRMVDADIDAAVALLGEGFPERTTTYWSDALERLRGRSVPAGRPRYGYVLADDDRLVGIILLIFSESDAGHVRANVSSWYVRPDYRGYSHMLLAAPLKAKDVSLFNISPAPTTISTIGAQGFTQYVSGSFVTAAALARPRPGASVRRVGPSDEADTILTDHARWGCLSYEVVRSGIIHPFVFVPQRILGGRVPCAQLAYCRDLADFVRFAGPLGRRLLRAGFPLVLVDTDRPLEGLFGLLRSGRAPKFCRGPDVPRLSDLSYTELAIFGA